MGDMGSNKSSAFKSCLTGFIMNVGLFILVCGYSVGGAYVFIYLEKGAEQERINQKAVAADNLRGSMDYIVQNSWYLSSQHLDRDEFIFKVYRNLDLYRNFIVISSRDQYYDGKRNEWDYDWTFSKTVLFTVTTIGTIGYGHITPVTFNGQFFCIYYGMIGVPLFLLFLANIGDFLARTFKYIYSRLCCRWCRMRRVVSELNGSEKLKPRILWDDVVGEEVYMDTDTMDVPIMVNLCVIFAYLMIGGILFNYWEEWQIHEAIYFCFITLTTIGFGDYVPGNSFSGDSDDAVFIASMKMVVTIAYCVFGMALLSMAINLMQEQLIAKTKWLGEQLGIGKEEEEDFMDYNYKKHEPGTVLETPSDKDGNQMSIAQAEERRRQKIRQKKRGIYHDNDYL